MKRRIFLSALAGSGAAAGLGIGPVLAQSGNVRQHPLWPLWEAWRQSYLDFSGRVVDLPQGSASHSEGQGYGMFLAAEFGDGDAFQRMAEWTDANLAIRSDNLLAWRWRPDVPERVLDTNNASDGDLFYAWALLRGAARFNEPRWQLRAVDIAVDLGRKCIAMRPDRPDVPVLLPAALGFADASGLTVNPSYMMPRALREVSEATGVTQLSQAARSGLDLMAEIAAVRLVPDWLKITPSGIINAERFSSNMGYEALRVPLFLAWSGEDSHPALRRAAAAWSDAIAGGSSAQTPTVLDSTSGAVLETSSDAGYRSVAEFVDCVVSQSKGAMMPTYTTDQPYYPATLQMFAILSQYNEYPSCLPI
jgi:endo-1,4-beta-D-glucanase Y